MGRENRVKQVAPNSSSKTFEVSGRIFFKIYQHLNYQEKIVANMWIFSKIRSCQYLKYHEKVVANIWVLRTKIVANIWIPPKIVPNIWILRKSGSRPRPCRWSCPRCQGLLWEGGVRVHILSYQKILLLWERGVRVHILFTQKWSYSKKEGCIDRFQFRGPFVLYRSWQMKSILSVLH